MASSRQGKACLLPQHAQPAASAGPIPSTSSPKESSSKESSEGGFRCFGIAKGLTPAPNYIDQVQEGQSKSLTERRKATQSEPRCPLCLTFC